MNFSVTVILVVLTVLASLYAWNRPDIMEKWMMNPYRVDKRREYYRFFTSGFIHADYIHLTFNMLALYSFGEAMERVFAQLFGGNGTWAFLALYLLGIVVSDVPTYYKHRSNSDYNSLGASGGVSSVVFAFILFYPQA
nr:rhomboid family intramembrane serine protease [Cytophagales bacterium]